MRLLHDRILELKCEDASLRVQYDNRGEPFREGVDFRIEANGQSVGVFLEDSELTQLRDLLNALHPPVRCAGPSLVLGANEVAELRSILANVSAAKGSRLAESVSAWFAKLSSGPQAPVANSRSAQFTPV